MCIICDIKVSSAVLEAVNVIKELMYTVPDIDVAHQELHALVDLLGDKISDLPNPIAGRILILQAALCREIPPDAVIWDFASVAVGRPMDIAGLREYVDLARADNLAEVSKE